MVTFFWYTLLNGCLFWYTLYNRSYTLHNGILNLNIFMRLYRALILILQHLKASFHLRQNHSRISTFNQVKTGHLGVRFSFHLKGAYILWFWRKWKLAFRCCRMGINTPYHRIKMFRFRVCHTNFKEVKWYFKKKYL